MTAALEKVIRPIVEGQIRGFLKEHPSIVAAVDWYKPRNDKATTFVNSLAKRIVRDLTCGTSAARLAVALLETATEAPHMLAVAPVTAAEPARLATDLSEPGPSAYLRIEEYHARRRSVLRTSGSPHHHDQHHERAEKSSGENPERHHSGRVHAHR